ASAAVRRALAPNISSGSKRIGLPARDAQPTTRASLAAPEAGALPRAKIHERLAHGPVRANFDLADFFENVAGNHTNAERGTRSAESRGARPPRLPFGAPSRRTFRRGASESVCTRASRSQRRARRWLRRRRARSPEPKCTSVSLTGRFVRISIWRIFLRISRGIIRTRSAESRGTQPPRLPFGAPSRRT